MNASECCLEDSLMMTTSFLKSMERNIILKILTKATMVMMNLREWEKLMSRSSLKAKAHL